MTYLYHFVPKNLQGHILYPLNQLKEKLPEVYQKEVAKYAGREHVMQMKIPFLNCLWNDTLHFSAVNPREAKKALDDAGYDRAMVISYYQVEPELLDPRDTVVYLNEPSEDNDRMREENFVHYRPDEVDRFAYIPEATKKYYREKISEGKSPLMYHQIPHILYRGTLDVSNLPKISI